MICNYSTGSGVYYVYTVYYHMSPLAGYIIVTATNTGNTYIFQLPASPDIFYILLFHQLFPILYDRLWQRNRKTTRIEIDPPAEHEIEVVEHA